MKLRIRVIPSSSRDAIVGWLEDTLRIKVMSPPEKGKANKTVIKLLETTLELPKGSIIIESGHTASIKVISINTEDDILVKKRLAQLSEK